MSQSPRDLADKGELARYRAGWTALNTLLSQDGSLSGRERNCVFLSCGATAGSAGVKFANVSALSGFDFPDDARAVALTDWDHDGDLDLWVNNRTAPRVRLLQNQSAPSGSVALRLEGQGDVNRDAVGAKAVLKLRGGDTMTQSVQAGGGYLAQSSKWLHFGIPTNAQIESVTVVWPGGESEPFRGIGSGGHFVLRRGSGQAMEWQRPERASGLAAAEAEVPAATGRAAIVLPRRIPAPTLQYSDPDGALTAIEFEGRPLLLLFFAPWCPNCRSELEEIGERAAEVREAGLDVLALSVDQDASQRSAAERLLAELDFPFRWGLAPEQTISKVKHLENMLFELQIPPAVPFGFMLDGNGDVYSAYRGSVSVDLLLHDADLAEASNQRLRDESVPFPGRWYTMHPGEVSILELLADHFQKAFPNDAITYLERALPQLAGGAATRVQKRLAGLHYQVGSVHLTAGRDADAETHFRAAVGHVPSYAAAQHDLGAALFRLGRLREAEERFLKTLELLPGNTRAQGNLDVVRKEIAQRGEQKP